MEPPTCLRTAGLLLTYSLLSATPAVSQGAASDYYNAESFRARFGDGVTGDRVKSTWLRNGDLIYAVNRSTGVGGEQNEDVIWIDVDAPEGRRKQTIFTGEQISDSLSVLRVLGLAQATSGAIEMLAEDGEVWQFDLETHERERVDVGRETAFDLPHQNRTTAVSRNRGARTSIVFANRSSEKVELFWIDPDGNERSYGFVRPGGNHVSQTYAGHLWLIRGADKQTGVLFRATDRACIARVTKENLTSWKPGAREPAVPTPTAMTSVERRAGNLFWIDREANDARQLTTDGSSEDSYSRRLRWSPTRSAFATFQNRHAEFQRQVTIVESAPRGEIQPRKVEFDYTKPGDPLDFNRPKVFLVDDQMNATPIEIDDADFGTPWRINQTSWTADGTRFRFLNNQRGHQRLAYQEIDIRTGKLRTLIDERSDTFINYSNKTYLSVSPDGKRAVWMSERSGWNHLYLYDLDAGEVVRPLTEGEWLVRSVESIDWSTGRALLRVQVRHADQDPYHIHYARLDLVTRELTELTSGDGTHTIEFSNDGTHYIDRYSRVDLPTVTELRRSSDGSLVCELAHGKWDDIVAAGWRPQQRFVAHGRDGETEIWGIVTRPTNFDPNQKYPIVEYIYAGPHGQHVPKSFRAHSKMRELAELGFIVVQIDGMGTNWRSKEFHDVAWKNLADAGFPDRRLWIEAFAATEPAADLSRVGIFGGSAGGQNAMRALIDHHDFYSVAVADCGCHDNRMDKIWWNEAWMGWPVDESYARSSNVTHAHRTQGSLLLIVGALDRNVDPASTMQVVDALIRADKDFDLLVIPSAGHSAAETPYGTRRRRDFLVRELLGVEPRWK